jgi:hypothetical protein
MSVLQAPTGNSATEAADGVNQLSRVLGMQIGGLDDAQVREELST